jgi:hypothetical protein
MNRDNIIDEKIQSLKELEKKIKDKLENQEKFITNLKVGSINLRTVNNEQALNEAFEIIYNKEEANNAFIKVVVDPDTAPDYIEFKIDGYTYDEWVHDFRILYIKISASKKLDAVSKAIKQLEDYYSDDKQTENKFNALLSDIANIMK